MKRINYNITQEASDRAHRNMKERFRGLSEAERQSMQALKSLYPIARIEIFSRDNLEFHTYVFLETNDQVTKSESDGSRERIEEEIYQQLEKVGRGSRPEVKIRFEYDSAENVKENFQGSYHLRMR